LGPEKSGRLREVPDKNEILTGVVESNWPLLTGGRYSQVVVKSGLNAHKIILVTEKTFKFCKKSFSHFWMSQVLNGTSYQTHETDSREL
jgi:hypothetical protein